MLTVVGEIAASVVKHLPGPPQRRPAYRLETVLHTDGAELTMTFFAKRPGHLRLLGQEVRRRRAAACFAGQVGRFGGRWQLTNPKAVLFGEDRATRTRTRFGGAARAAAASTRSTPSPRGVDSWDLQRLITFARTVVDDLPEVRPGRGCAERHGSARTPAPRWTGSTRRRTSTRWRRPAALLPLRGGAGHPGAAGPAPGRDPSRRAPRPAPAAVACSRRSTPGCPSS